MAISTISPQNTTQQSTLMQSLSGTGANLMSALNSAIQKSRDDAQVRLKQEQNFLTEQQRNIENDRIERFNVQDRTEFALNFDQQQQNNALDRGKKRLDLDQLGKDNMFENSEREKLIQGDATNADSSVRQASQDKEAIEKGLTKNDQLERDLADDVVLRKANADKTSLAIQEAKEAEAERQAEIKSGKSKEVIAYEQKRASDLQYQKDLSKWYTKVIFS